MVSPPCSQPGPHHWTRVVSKGSVKGLDVLELKHVPLDKGFADLLVGPGNGTLISAVLYPTAARAASTLLHSMPGLEPGRGPPGLGVGCMGMAWLIWHRHSALYHPQTEAPRIHPSCTHQKVSSRMQSSWARPSANTGISTCGGTARLDQQEPLAVLSTHLGPTSEHSEWCVFTRWLRGHLLEQCWEDQPCRQL
ncbi:hypothetical protein MC885_003868 [Smutsia gigantea]|nr:hypothetical protein MC885_003868 [Smutsia gigantea]